MGEKIIEETKKVNLTELFYDLVFVFGISKITHILERRKAGQPLHWHFYGLLSYNFYNTSTPIRNTRIVKRIEN